jgi:hypothetical protein
MEASSVKLQDELELSNVLPNCPTINAGRVAALFHPSPFQGANISVSEQGNSMAGPEAMTELVNIL